MNVIRQIALEIRHRSLNFSLSLIAISAAVALFVAFFSAGQASKKETIRLMRDIGFNLRVIPNETDMDRFWLTGFSEHTMPEHYAEDLAAYPGVSYNHLTATLQKRIRWRDREVILTGMAPEVIPPGKQSSPMTFSIDPGTAYIGFELAKDLDLNVEDRITFGDQSLRIVHRLAETGSQDDIHIFVHLSDAQNILRLHGRINEIKALQCLCTGEYDHLDSIDQLRTQLTGVLPDAKVIIMESIATARQKQRFMAERYFSFVFPLILLVIMIWIGALAFLNARERRQEIGVLRAVGYGSGRIAALFMGKAIMTGLAGAALGFVAGTVLALNFGPRIFTVTAAAINPSLVMLLWSLLASPLICALAVFIPTMAAVYQDPAATLREE
jgi:ABC-type lipoprotein release transport system permease subunit